MTLKRSTDRILTTHQGSLARPPDLMALLMAKQAREPYDADALAIRLQEAVAEVVRQQVSSGIDIVNDGEFSKTGWAAYFVGRLDGLEVRRGQRSVIGPITARDARLFPEWFDAAQSAGGPQYSWVARAAAQRHGVGTGGVVAQGTFCTGPLSYVGRAEVETDIANLKAAAEGLPVSELCLTALAPATTEFFVRNEHYSSDEAFVFAIADAMRAEYRAITDAGILLQLDEPALATNWQVFPDMSLTEYRRWVEVRVEALNHALAGIPPERVRVHVCWGSIHHPHAADIPVEEILDLLLKINTEGLSLEAANPRHAHDWEVFLRTRLPDDKVLIPGVIGHYTDFVEHPGLVAERLVNYANVVGRERVIAGTDCGIGTRVGHPEIGWSKFQAMAEGARLATRSLWGGPVEAAIPD
jgi:5-methyltetrahydropteroyltriglutamate--homocysteine methyltransferase